MEDEGGVLISVRAVYYENVTENPLCGAMTGSNDTDEPDTERDISKGIEIG